MAVNSARRILITFFTLATLWSEGIYVARFSKGTEFGLATAVLNTPVCRTWGWLCAALLSVSFLLTGVLRFQGPNFLNGFFKLFVHSRHVLHSLGKRSLNCISVG
jgi:hypothetical protein